MHHSLLFFVRRLVVPAAGFGVLATGAWGEDQVISNNVIITESLAVGKDAEDGEPFGYDTLRLKENNVRLHFEDTSSASIFPRNDWRIVINDIENGGDDYFAVEDASASNKIFRIEAGAPENSLWVNEAGDMVVGGRMGIGIAAPSSNNIFQVNASLPDKRVLIGAGDSGVATVLLNVDGAGYFRGDLEVGSSRALKDDITALEPAAARDALQALEPVRFRYKDSSEAKVGFIAEDVPDLVATENRKSLSPMDLIGVLTSVVKEQQEEIARLRDRLEVIEKSLPQPR